VILQKVASGEYRSVVELVEEALFLLVERDWSRSQAELQEQMPSVFQSEPEPTTPGDQ
jgi:Arc/MetJ-type ribon-helix-helix transcriptional regulator